MLNPKIFLGPMSRAIVDAAIEFCRETNIPLGLIPSRRQIDFNGGYVGWTTKEFCEYVRSRTDKILLQRDHGGPNQAISFDYGYDSFRADAEFMDLIHIDPWVKTGYMNATKETVNYMNFCLQFKSSIKFEIGTEEAIHGYSADQLEELITIAQKEIGMGSVVYAVIQSGTALQGTQNIGTYSEQRLTQMVDVCHRHQLRSKEHNGDFLNTSQVKGKFALGLDAINLAPEIAQIHTNVFLDLIVEESRSDLFDLFFALCHKSKRWVKWVPPGFDPEREKEQVIKISGHYVFNAPEFGPIREAFPVSDFLVKKRVKTRLLELQ